MITLKKAKEIAIGHFNEGVRIGFELVLIESETIEFEDGYVFSANTGKYIIEGDEGYRISGVSPVLVSKKNGEVFNPYVNQYIYSEDLIKMYKIRIKV